MEGRKSDYKLNYYKNKVAWCPICSQGWVQIFKDKETNEFFVCCDECESRWEHPTEVKYTNKATTIFDTDIQIQDPTEDEIRVKGWERYIVEN